MPADTFPTRLLISAQIRAASVHGVTITVMRKGDPDSGSILLKINRLDGMVELLGQVWMDDERVWTPLQSPSVLAEAEAEALAAEAAENDPDLWIVEVEDKQGRSWFPGKIVDF